MNTYIKTLILLLVSLLASCSPTTNHSGSVNEQCYNASWEMMSAIWDNDANKAVALFDELLSCEPDSTYAGFVLEGLDLKLRLGLEKDVRNFLLGFSDHDRNKYCCAATLSHLRACTDIVNCDEPVANESLQRTLIEMYAADQYVRGNRLYDVETTYGLDSSSYQHASSMEVADRTNRAQLDSIINEFGFPTRKLVGKTAMRAVFLIIQHADRDLPWQRKQLAQIEQAAAAGDLRRADYAYVQDRVRVNIGQPQVYYTQYVNDSLINFAKGIVDGYPLAEINGRRMEVGLMPLELYYSLR